MERVRKDSKVLLGIIFIVVGFVFIASNFELLPRRIMHYLFTWQMLLMGIGVVLMISQKEKTGGLIIFCVGLFFYLPDYFDVSYRFRHLFIPVVLIIIGISILSRSRRISSYPSSKPHGSNADYIDEVAILGGGKRNITTNNFKGGRITAIFGGSEINLLNSKLAEGNNVLDFVAIFGGGTITVPDDWQVRVETISILGGFSDNRKKSIVQDNDKKTLIIKGFAIFGGGEIK